MKKGKQVWVGVLVVLLIVGVLFGLFSSGVLRSQSALASSFTPVYCNDPKVTCCVPDDVSSVKSLGLNSPFVCPGYSINCVVTNLGGSAYIYTGSQNCGSRSFLGISYYKCDDEVKSSLLNSGGVNVVVPKGHTVYSDRSVQASLTVKGQKLVNCVGAGCTQGVTIKSSSCTFDVSGGQKLTNNAGVDLGTSYTIPLGDCGLTWNSGDRHICGNLEEQCSSDGDCVGHTFGNKECTSRTLQTYGCKELSVPSGIFTSGGDYYQKDSVSGYNNVNGVLSRCEIKSAVSVQCCGDSDCGSNAVCDTTSFTCKATGVVSCTSDSQCGVSTQCDFTTKMLKTPDCLVTGKCGYTSKSVGCCSDVNCATGEYCTASNVCAVKKDVKTVCPFECCVSDSGYVDRLCSNSLNCVNHVCQVKPECTKDSDCNVNYQCKDLKCVLVEESCTGKLGGLVPGKVVTEQRCGLLSACWFGLSKPTAVSSCVYDWTFVALILGGVVLVLLAFAFNKGKKGGKGFVSNKKFWLALLVVGLGVLLWLYWAYALIIVVVLLFLLFVLKWLGVLDIIKLVRRK